MLSKILLTVTIQCEGKCHPRKTLHCSRSLAKKIRLLLGFWNSDLISNHVARFPLALLRTGLCWLCIHPLALLRSLHLYHLGSFHGFISTKVLLPETANPRPACSNNFLQFAPSCSLFPSPQCLYLGVRAWGGRERRKEDAQVTIRFLFGVISVASRESARLQSLWRAEKRMQWREQQLAFWPGDPRSRTFVTFLITVICAFRLYIPCVPVKFGRICTNGFRVERFRLSYGALGNAASGKGVPHESKMLASSSKAVLSRPDQIFFFFNLNIYNLKWERNTPRLNNPIRAWRFRSRITNVNLRVARWS